MVIKSFLPIRLKLQFVHCYDIDLKQSPARFLCTVHTSYIFRILQSTPALLYFQSKHAIIIQVNSVRIDCIASEN